MITRLIYSGATGASAYPETVWFGLLSAGMELHVVGRDALGLVFLHYGLSLREKNSFLIHDCILQNIDQVVYELVVNDGIYVAFFISGNGYVCN